MALDNVELDNLQAGDDVATDLIATDHYQLVKLTYGALGTANVVTDTATNPFPVALSDTDNAVLDSINSALAGSLSVDGATVTVDLGANNDVTIDGSSSVSTDDTSTHTAATTTAVNIAAVASPTDTTVDANDIAMPGMSTDRRLWTDAQIVGQDANLTVDLGATDNAVLDSIQTAVEVIDNPVLAEDAAFSGGSVMMAGAIRDDALSALTPAEGDAVPLRVSSTGALHVTGGGGGTEYTEDVATPGPIVGKAGMMERDDALSTLTPIEGDWAAMRCSAEGALWTQDFNSDAMAASLANIEAAVGGVYAEDTAHNSADEGVMTLAVRNDTLAALAGTDGDYAPFQVNASGALYTVSGANDGVDIGDVDVTSVTPGTGATDLGKAVDSAAGATDTGVVGLAIRDDALTTLTPADGDYVPLRVSSTGALHVTGGGGGTEYTDDTSTHATGSSAGSLFMAAATPTDGSVDANDIGAVAMSTDRRLHVDAQIVGTDAALDVSAATVTVDLGVNNDVTVTGGETPADADATPTDAVPVQAFNSVYNGTTWDLMREGSEAGSLLVDLGANNDVTVSGTVTVDGSGVTQPVSISDTSFAVADGNALGEGILIQGDDGTDRKNINVDATTGDVQVDVTNTVTVGSHDVTNAGTFATQVDGAALTALQLIDNPVLAHDTAVGSTQVSMAGARASNSIEGITQVANGDGTRIAADLNGVLLSRPHTTPEEHISERVSDTAGTSTNFTNFAAGGAGIHNYVCDVTITNTSATDAYVDLRDGSAGSVIWTFPAPANSGATHSFSLPLKGAANTALAYDVSAAITTMYISVNGFQAQG